MRYSKALLVLFITAVGTTVSAHHSLKAYDQSKTVPLSGVIRKVEIANPHVRIVLESPAAGGSTTSWDIEMTTPGVIRRRGIDVAELKVGSKVIVESWLNKDGSHVANGRTLVTADGRRLDVSDFDGWTSTAR